MDKLSEVRILSKQEPRVETGNLQFGDDWIGLFIRGDNCIEYAADLDRVLQMSTNIYPIRRFNLKRLVELLSNTNERNN